MGYRDMLSGCARLVRQTGLLHSVDEPNELFLCMGQSYIIVFAFSALLGKIGGKGRVPVADVLRCVVDGKA